MTSSKARFEVKLNTGLLRISVIATSARLSVGLSRWPGGPDRLQGSYLPCRPVYPDSTLRGVALLIQLRNLAGEVAGELAGEVTQFKYCFLLCCRCGYVPLCLLLFLVYLDFCYYLQLPVRSCLVDGL